MTDQKLDLGQTEADRRALENAFHQLLDELESPGDVDVASILERMPEPTNEKNPIKSPWEREGYENKAAWLENNRGGPD